MLGLGLFYCGIAATMRHNRDLARAVQSFLGKKAMTRLVLESFLLLLYFEFIMLVRDFRYLHQLVRRVEVEEGRASAPWSPADLCHAIDLGCVFYLKHVRCLQRSAAAALLLRRYGWRAELVIGAQLIPFKSHAWCEVDGLVVNDRPYMRDIYQVLERC